MAIKFTCPECGCTLLAPDGSVGRDIRCGGCRAVFPVPGPREEPREPREDEPRRDDDQPPFEDDPPSRDASPPPADDYDDDQRPRPVRRRRRRRHPLPPERSPVMLVMMICAVLAVVSCAGCGVVYLLIPGERWQTHKSVEGGFQVELPGPPDRDMPIPNRKPGELTKAEGTMLWKRLEEYVIVYAALPPPGQRGATDDALLDEAVRGMQTSGEVQRIVRNERTTVSGFPAREVEFVSHDGGTYLGRVVVTDKMLYAVIGGGVFARSGNTNARRFINSFQVTEPKQARRW